jgi:hypothetical protein
LVVAVPLLVGQSNSPAHPGGERDHSAAGYHPRAANPVADVSDLPTADDLAK